MEILFIFVWLSVSKFQYFLFLNRSASQRALCWTQCITLQFMSAIALAFMSYAVLPSKSHQGSFHWPVPMLSNFAFPLKPFGGATWFFSFFPQVVSSAWWPQAPTPWPSADTVLPWASSWGRWICLKREDLRLP